MKTTLALHWWWWHSQENWLPWLFLSDNDPYINMDNAKKYYSKLENIKFVEFSKKGHFNKSAGVLELGRF